MKQKTFQRMELTAYAIIGLNFLTVVLHSVAHEILRVKATSAQLAFIIPVIIVAPVVSGFVLPKFKKAGAILLLLSMVGSFFFGLYYHFVAHTIDHVSHVATLEPAFWGTIFVVTAYLLLLVEIPGAIVGLLLLNQAPTFKNYVARTDF